VSAKNSSFGRVDDDNNVYLIEDSIERKVGQYPGVPSEEALAYFVRKFEDLESQVRILEQRVAAKADASGLKKNLTKIGEELVAPSAVGDLADLRRRVANLTPKIDALVSERLEANKEVAAASLAERIAIAEKAEALIAQDESKIQWKNTGAEMTKLFEQWQALQKSGPKVSKTEADAIWKRFSAARTKFEASKRQYFAGLDAANKAAKAKKNELVAKAEALVAKGSDAVADYRDLLSAWKLSGRSNSKTDDELWARFKAAGDSIYSAKSAEIAVASEEQTANLAAKLLLLAEAEKIDPAKDLTEAKKQLLSVQQRWEKAGRVPKEKLRETEDKLRAVESKIRKIEEENWRNTDPAVIDRKNSVVEQLMESILKLESEAAAAKESKDKKRIDAANEALAARKAWLEVVKGSSK
jgi:hypothetical protein